MKSKANKISKTKKEKGLSIKTKLISVTGLLLTIPFIILGFIGYITAKSELENSGKIILKNSVEATLLVIEDKQKLVDEGKLTLQDAQESVREYMLGKKDADGKRPINKNFNLGKNGYLLAYTQDAVEAAHPSMEGKSVIDVKDKKTGALLVQEQIKAGNNGGGYVNYWWTLPNSESIAKKITYQKTDPHWGWVVSAGSYMSDFDAGSNKILYVSLILLIIVGAIGTVIIVIFARHISKPIKKIEEAVDLVASGDLNVQEFDIKNKDEIGKLYKSFKVMVKNFNNLLTEVKGSVDVVVESSVALSTAVDENTSAVNEVSASMEEIAKSSTEQAKQTESGVIRVKNLADRIEMVTDLTSKTNDSAATTAKIGGKGLEAIKVVSQKSEENNKAVEKANDIITEVDRNSIEIGAITEAIAQISEQTNLLSLNAAIEAARAGEMGKGFAVVAEEVRKLASQSAESASKVKELISGIQEKSKMAVKAMEEEKTIAKEQSKAVIEAEKIFQDILDSIEKITNDIKAIKDYSVEMEHEKNEIVGVLENLSASTEENSAATQQVSATTEQQLSTMEAIASRTIELNKLSEKLSAAVNAFKI